MPGTLYLVSTPIGNLEDLTLRALRILKEVDLIAAEDTRDTRKLTSHFAIATPLVSFHQHSRQPRTQWLLEQLQNGKSVALVSSAGTPVISDPGAELVRRCGELGLKVVPIPGASAVLAALAASGCDGQQFFFAGFLPRKSGARRRALERLRDRAETLIFYESPERVAGFLGDARATLGDREAVVARELTKKFEEFSRGTLSALRDRWKEGTARGEFTVVIAGAAESASEDDDHATRLPAAMTRFQSLLSAGNERREALRRAALECGVPRNVLYDALVAAGR